MDNQLTRNFSLDEFACKCGCGIEDHYVHKLKTLALTFQLLRNEINIDPTLQVYKDRAHHKEFRLIPTSVIRCEKHNRDEGGKKKSYHLRAEAGDITCPGLPTSILYEKAKTFFPGCCWYKGRHFVHCDVRPITWHNIKEPSPELEEEVQVA